MLQHRSSGEWDNLRTLKSVVSQKGCYGLHIQYPQKDYVLKTWALAGRSKN
jgi:hypothetical protein